MDILLAIWIVFWALVAADSVIRNIYSLSSPGPLPVLMGGTLSFFGMLTLLFIHVRWK